MKILVLNQITLCADGSIGIQWLKQVLDPDTGEILFSEPHRTAVDFDGDADLQIDEVSKGLQAMGYGAVTAKMRTLIKRVDGLGKSDDAINARRDAKISAKAEARAEEVRAAKQAQREAV